MSEKKLTFGDFLRPAVKHGLEKLELSDEIPEELKEGLEHVRQESIKACNAPLLSEKTDSPDSSERGENVNSEVIDAEFEVVENT